MIEGGCLCGGIRYRYEGEIEHVSVCHCAQCRKAQGSAFAAVAPVAKECFHFLSGAELISEYRSSPGKVRAFCKVCGSPIYSAKDDAPGLLRLRLGTVDTPFVCADIFHIFADSKAPWWEIGDGHPRYPQFKP